MNKLQELSICISSTENNVEITMTKENFDKVNCELERLEKLEKAWEIVKNKNIDFELIKIVSSVDRYNKQRLDSMEYDYDDLTETEFNLLKEMLGEK